MFGGHVARVVQGELKGLLEHERLHDRLKTRPGEELMEREGEAASRQEGGCKSERSAERLAERCIQYVHALALLAELSQFSPVSVPAEDWLHQPILERERQRKTGGGEERKRARERQRK